MTVALTLAAAQRGNLLIYGFFASNILDQGIPVEYELDTFSVPSTSTTKIYYVDPSATPLSKQNYTVTLNTSLTRPTTRCHFQHPAKPFRLKHPASLNTTSLAAPRTNLHKAANKNFRYCMCVLPKNSFAIHICCHKIYSVRENYLIPSKPL